MAYKDYGFRPDDFRGMRFDVMAVNKQQAITTAFPELAGYAELMGRKGQKVSPTKIFRYVALMYDPNTPLKRIQDYHERRAVAAEAAGFLYNEEGEFDAPSQKVITLRDYDAQRIMMRFLTLFHSMDMMVMERIFMTIHEKLYIEDIKSAMSALESYKQIQNRILNGDGPEAEAVIYKILLAKQDVIKSLRPEHYARNWEKKKDGEEE